MFLSRIDSESVMVEPPKRPAGSFSRRTLLGGALALATGAAGCRSGGPQPPATVTSLTQGHPFYVAHRGGGGDWPEMTAYAYEQAARLPGLHALEISVCICADGVLVCHHDPTTLRTTGVDYTIAEQTWSTLSTLKVTASATTDPAQPAQPLTRFDDVVERYIDRFVLFVEPKVPAAVTPLLDRMSSLGQPERVVWKQYVNSPVFRQAKDRGFATWGYVLNEPSHLGANLTRLAASPIIDLLGAPADESTNLVTEVVAAAIHNDKQTIMSVVRTEADRSRALRLGCSGLMASRIAELLGQPSGG